MSGVPLVRRGDVVAAAIVAATIALAGVPLGLLWTLVGPHVDLAMYSYGADLADYHTEAFIAGDMMFGIIGLAAGAVSAVVVWVMSQWRGPTVLAGLAIGCLGGALATWQVGIRIGEGDYQRLLSDAEVGQHFSMPMDLRSTGLLFLQAIVAVIVYVVHAVWARDPGLGVGWNFEVVSSVAAGSVSSVPADSISSVPAGREAPPATPAPHADETASSPLA